ncbi:DUF3267 domain-containing protein [Streptococcus porcinus]
MKILEDVNVTDNKRLLIFLNLFSLFLFLSFLYFFPLIADAIKPFRSGSIDFDLASFLWTTGLMVFLLVLHEGIHGIFFKIFQLEGKIKFGVNLKNMVVYCISPNSCYSRMQMIWISIAPFIFITFGLTLLYYLEILSPFLYVILAALHAGGCAGDFYYCYLLGIKYFKLPVMAEDTKAGLIIYHK